MDNQQLKNNYDIVKKDLENIKNLNKSLNGLNDKEYESDNKYKELIKTNNELKNNINLKDKEILKLNSIIEQFNKEKINKKDNNIKEEKAIIININNKNDFEVENKINDNKSFNNLYKKYISKNLHESKVKMIIGVYLQKQSIEFNKKYNSALDKNDKLINQIKKLNDKIIGYKFNNLNINSARTTSADYALKEDKKIITSYNLKDSKKNEF